MEVKTEIYQKIHTLLQKLLVSSDAGERQRLEDELKWIQNHVQEYGVELSSIVSSQSEALEMRQLSLVLLRQYAEAHWNSNHSPPAPPCQAKVLIRSLLCKRLGDPSAKIRMGVAYALSVIAKLDWPTEWPDLFIFVSDAVASSDADLVHGAIQLLTELASIVDESQLENITPVLFPHLLKIIDNQRLYSVRTRSRAVNAFNTLASSMDGRIDEKCNRRKRLLLPWLQRFGKVLIVQLDTPDDHYSDSGFKIGIVACLNMLIGFFPKQIAKWFGCSLISSALILLVRAAEHHVQSVTDENSDEDEGANSDGDVLGMEQLTFQICELIQRTSSNACFTEYLKPHYAELFYHVLCLLQLPGAKVEIWCENVDLFVEEEDEENSMDSIRIVAKELMLTVCDDHYADCASGLCRAVKRHLSECKIMKSQNGDNWWKQLEATITGLGCVVEFLLNENDKVRTELNLMELLTECVFPSLEPSNFLLLRGQSLWFLSRIVASLPTDWQKRLCEVCVLFLGKDQPRVTKVCATRALYNICEEIRFSKHVFLLDEQLEKIITGLISVAVGSNETVVSLALNTLQSCTAACPTMMSKYERKIGPLMVACCLKYSGDPLIPSQSCDIIKCLVKVEDCRKRLEERVLPTAVSVLRSPYPKRLPVQLPAVCLDLILSLVKGSGPPLSEKMLNEGLGTVVECVLNSDEIDTLASGRECIRAFLDTSPAQVLQWCDDKGNTGLSLIVDVICHFLNPEAPDLPGSMVCRLVYALLKEAGPHVKPYFNRIMMAVISKSAGTEVASVRQSLIIMWAYLFNYEVHSVVQFLSISPSPSISLGDNALEFVVKDWCEHHRRFTGIHDKKVSTLALCQLFQYCVGKISERILQSVVVGVRKEPILLHIFRLIIEELRISSSDADQKDNENAEYSTSTEEMEVLPEQELHRKKSQEHYYVASADTCSDIQSDKLAEICRELEELSSSEENLENESVDELKQLNLQEYLVGFLREFKKNEYYQSFLERIEEPDVVLLRDLQLA